MWVLGIELWSPCLCDNHFTGSVPAPQPEVHTLGPAFKQDSPIFQSVPEGLLLILSRGSQLGPAGKWIVYTIGMGDLCERGVSVSPKADLLAHHEFVSGTVKTLTEP